RKTLLVGTDMRRPALARNFKLDGSLGLSNFLSGQCAMEEIFYPSNNERLTVIPGGHVPPNPAELMTTNRMDELVNYTRKEYEIVVFDTPPIGLVSDTIELAKRSFIPLLIVRQDVTYKKSLDAITEMYHAGKYKNLGIVMNDVNYTRFDYGTYYGRSYGYGSGFGYGYYDDEHKRSIWKRLFHSK
ncbi:MAG: CpsD/CapB family tyrosine-protein kinase, partial [Cytophagales bacterium]|nr:CpsD/CapB family tyrosine-protein kinase [Cytophagales bacterium]